MGRVHPVSPADPEVSPLQDASRARSLTATLPLAITPHLTLWRLLGEGGASRVYEAHDRRLARRVAVKLLDARDDHGGTARERLLREAELYARIEDPRTPGVYEVASLGDGTPYVVMEYVAGQSLADRLRQEPTSFALACEITSEILSALSAVHRHGIVHRDVKPSNIILEPSIDGRLRARLVDFGIAKASAFSDLQLTLPGSLLGTPQYMAPEQLAGAEADARADLYATGLVFYEMLLGVGPHRKNSIGDLVAARMRDDLDLGPLTRAGIPSALCEFLRRSLARDPEARFSSAEEMQCELHAARAEQHCAWVSPLSSEPPRLAAAARAEDSGRTPRAVLDASGTHSVGDDTLEGVRPPRGRGAVYGLLFGFGLTFGVGVWLLQPQLSGNLRTDEAVETAGRAEQQPAPSVTIHPSAQLAAQPAAAASPSSGQPPAPPPPIDAPALAPGAAVAPEAKGSKARLAADVPEVPVATVDAKAGAISAREAAKRGAVEARRAARESRTTARPARSERRALQPIWDLRSEPRGQSASQFDGVPANPY